LQQKNALLFREKEASIALYCCLAKREIAHSTCIMTNWKGKTVDGAFAVELQASVLSGLDRYCRDAGSSETGGILVGRYSDDLSLAIVREATPPPTDSKRGHAWFVRGVNGLREMLGKRWQAKECTFYIGEWHFHPANHVEPSSDDFTQMLEISRAREYDCREPLLLILGARKHAGRRIFRAFVCPANRATQELLRVGA
jgi:integrative and conjugative element protein (TIGR02256 family)